jgi:hypothetical protein
MKTHCDRSSNRNLTILVLIGLIILCGAAWLAAYDDRGLRLSLVAFKPLVDGILPWGKVLEDRAELVLQSAQWAILGFGALVAASTLVWRTQQTCERAAFVLAGLLAMRFGSALSAMANTALTYFLVRDIAGRGDAIAAIAILAIDAKQISWSCYKFPHVATAFTAVAISWPTEASPSPLIQNAP